ncbi:amylo-alpha-1,6-glucosidase [Xanthocytophaga flava]|uniref:amylo-alpha-1,6-glucosidase n=1 Tax=Xanthocytophaga flava TaxID=3048013 RepID=UPI0028D17274|nr:amylo-alpha-1,6-glucosidase [Xanthocytophaga flavus]MDJ1472558.1 amylo-alpha-1,6-glucosidase [Xanthocytophaga flavus]
MSKNILLLVLIGIGLLSSCQSKQSPTHSLADSILANPSYATVKKQSLDIVKTGFNAGDGYGEVWIRDYNTFIELSAKVSPQQALRENLEVFFRLQGKDGNIVDGFIPRQKAAGGYDYIYSDLEPRYAGHKNTVETDQESSLVQAVYKFITVTKDTTFLTAKIGDKTVADRLEAAMDYLLTHRLDTTHGLLYGATTVDWGDVQPEHDWGVFITDQTHYTLDIYDNAMFIIALDNLIHLLPQKQQRWKTVRQSIAANCRKHLWDAKKQKFKPHIYLTSSPFPKEFNEDSIYYHGGTAIAIEADLLSKDEIKASLQHMIENVKASGAKTIGLTIYPPYPQGYFKNKGMYPYGYQNGGDWDWFGGRMIQQLVRYGFIEEAVQQLKPMADRAVKNKGFYEWYTPQNKPEGSGTFRGSAGVLYKAITLLEEWAEQQKVTEKQ